MLRFVLLSFLVLIAVGVGLILSQGFTFNVLLVLLVPLLLVGGAVCLSRPYIVGFLLIFLQYANIDVFFSRQFEAHSGYAFFAITMGYYFLLLRTGNPRTPLNAPTIWLAAFFVIGALTSAFAPHVDQEELAIWMRVVLYGFVAYLTCYWTLSSPKRVETAAVILTWTGLGLSIINIIEFLDRGLIDMSSTPGRSAGLHLNANPSAAAILLCFILSYFKPQPFLLLMRTVMFVGIYTTFSRATLAFAFLFVLFQEFVVEKLAVRRAIISIAFISIVMGIAAYGAIFIEKFGGRTVQYAHTRIEEARHGKFDDASTNSRVYVIGVNFRRFVEHPIVGGGGMSASAFEAPHNQILLVMAEQGSVGLVLYMGFLISVGIGLYRLEPGKKRRMLMAVAMFQALRTMVSHTLYHDRFSMIAFAILCAGVQVFPNRAPVAQKKAESMRRPEGTARKRLTIGATLSDGSPYGG